MNRPRNRQRREPRNDHQRQPGGSSRSSPATPQQAAGTVPTVAQVVAGASVFIVLKEDQPSGHETPGVVQDVLTRGNHPRGIKVRLRGGLVGRVQRMSTQSGPRSAASTSGPATGVAGSSSFTGPRDYRQEYPEEPPERTLMDFLPALEDDLQNSQLDGSAGDANEEIITCPVCEAFEGDEAAVTHHIEKDHFP
ncbi:hypothetical protein HIM_07606 [Hirsutella minnesotensis 3608]|uniref:UBZ4-type domain-containing protein n=1 Tax=Hirsutella minnesotensis 3608 TaxID=1043627 RepID=A0A0F8A464_9HYPO|nr:hypothetical protein HIM_07606 [Hirsutella minnesotensis 3608]